MPIGTATNRLKRMVLFDLVRRAGEDVCFACGTTIRTIEALTIEYKKSWYSGNTSLFWDVYNIAFSHAECNRSEPKRIEGPQGTSWCSTHQDFAPMAEFRKGTRWNGLAGDCNDCHRRELREYQRRRRALGSSNSNNGT